jgi:YD repeat-containing protein
VAAQSARAQNESTPATPSALLHDNHEVSPPTPEPTKADPVQVINGDFVVQETDLKLAGRGMDFTFTRTYRSGSDVHSTLGAKWDFNWNQSVVLEWHAFQPPPGGGASSMAPGGHQGFAPVSVSYFDGGQRIETFAIDPSSPTGLKTPAGYFAKMISSGPIGPLAPASFTLRSADGKIFTFDVMDEYGADPFILGNVYHLHTLIDRNGNTFTLSYESVGPTGGPFHSRLTAVTDCYGRSITFAYSSSGFLISVTDATNPNAPARVVTFSHLDQYNEANLTDVTSPAVLTAPWNTDFPPGANTFPNGKTVQYTYNPWDSTHGVAANNLLLTVTDARELATGGPPYVTNTYDVSYRVSTQVFGGTDPSSSVPSGGKYTFIYETAPQGNPWGWFTETNRTLCVDPNGNVTLSLFDLNGSDRLDYVFTGRVNPASISPSASISSVVTVTPSTPSTSNSICFPGAEQKLHSSDPGCFWTKKFYGTPTSLTNGPITEEVTAASDTTYTYDSSTDPFQQGNLLKVERIPVPPPVPDDGSTHIVTLYAYEPIFCQRRAAVDPLGNQILNKFDYQEAPIGTGTPIGTLVSIWHIDTTQSDQAQLFPSLPSITAASNQGDLNGDGLTNQAFGNVIVSQLPRTHILADPLNSGGLSVAPTAQAVITYNQFSLPKSQTDPEGHATSYLYNPVNDPTGQGQPTPLPDNGGFLNTKNSPEAVTEQFGYDGWARVANHVDGRHQSLATLFNELDQVCQTSNALGYLHRYFFDANNNVVEEDFSNRVPALTNPLTSDGMPTGGEVDGTSGAFITNRYQYDVLNHRTKADIQADGQARLVTQYRYDRVGNLARISHQRERVTAASA